MGVRSLKVTDGWFLVLIRAARVDLEDFVVLSSIPFGSSTPSTSLTAEFPEPRGHVCELWE